jgi:23S rRNA (uracil1939-C5)-methyltransferase
MSPRRSRRRKLPVEPVELNIESLSHEGRGVTRIDGKVAFVEGALAGETVRARYIQKRGQFDVLETEEVLVASKDRVTSDCIVSSVCGGCSLRHLHPEQQLLMKQSMLLEHLRHSAGLKTDAFELLPMLTADTSHYRRKARLAVRYVQKKGGALVGFREKHSSFITVMDDCQVLVAEVARLIPVLKELISNLSSAADIPQIEVAAGETEVVESAPLKVALVFRHLTPLEPADLDAVLAFAAQHHLHCYLQPAGPDSVHRIYPQQGEDRLEYFLPVFDLRLQFHPLDFTQVNGPINRQIVSRVIDLMAAQPGQKVLDLFCGLGNFTLPLARQGCQVTGVEGSDAMVKRGYENGALNELSNMEFHCADLSKPFADEAWAQTQYHKLLLDPPRSGALEVVQQIQKLAPEQIVYVSCNPATLARDSAELLAQGYRLKSAGVMDMFPHTNHVESMAVFDRQAS